MPAQTYLFPCLKDNFGVLHPRSGKRRHGVDRRAGSRAGRGGAEKDRLAADRHSGHPSPRRPHAGHRRAETASQMPRRRAAQRSGTHRACRRNGGRGRHRAGRRACRARVIDTPGHTAGHISYFFPADKLAFVGDTLFSIGCGRVIEGNPEMMWHSLLKLRDLPGRHAVLLRPRIYRRQYPLRQDHRAEQQGARGARRRSEAASRRRQVHHSGDDRRRKGGQSVPARRRCRAGEIARPSRQSGLESVRGNPRAQEPVLSEPSQRAHADDIIRLLDLKPHPEGGHFRETFRDARRSTASARHPRRSIFCSRAASVRIGIASMRPKSGIGMPARR